MLTRIQKVTPAWLDSCHAMKKPMSIPDKLIVLTFDDGNASDYTFVAPILKRCGFGTTFFVASNCDWLGIPGRDAHRMTWEQIRKLHDDGFTAA